MIGQTTVIGFGYKARRGKDTAVSAICAAYSVLARRYAFADALREQLEAAALDQWLQDGFDAETWTRTSGIAHLCSWAGVPYEPAAEKQRALLQWWGMWRREDDPDYWVKQVAQAIERDQPAFALLADLRFNSERAICDYTVRMDRPGFEIADGAHHISEHELDALPDDAWTAIIAARTADDVERSAVTAFETLAFAAGGIVPPGEPIVLGASRCCGHALTQEQYHELVEAAGPDRALPAYHFYVRSGNQCDA